MTTAFDLVGAYLSAYILSCKISPVVDRGIVFSYNDAVAVILEVYVRKSDLLSSFRCSIKAGSDHVDLSGLDSRNQCIKAHALEFHLAAHLFNDGVSQIKIEAYIFIILCKFKRRECCFRADTDNSRNAAFS